MNGKRARKRRKAELGTTKVPSYVRKINLVQYVKDRTRCTSGEARLVCLSGAIKVNSHPVGFKMIGGRRILDPYIDAKHRGDILISDPVPKG